MDINTAKEFKKQLDGFDRPPETPRQDKESENIEAFKKYLDENKASLLNDSSYADLFRYAGLKDYNLPLETVKDLVAGVVVEMYALKEERKNDPQFAPMHVMER